MKSSEVLFGILLLSVVVHQHRWPSVCIGRPAYKVYLCSVNTGARPLQRGNRRSQRDRPCESADRRLAMELQSAQILEAAGANLPCIVGEGGSTGGRRRKPDPSWVPCDGTDKGLQNEGLAADASDSEEGIL